MSLIIHVDCDLETVRAFAHEYGVRFEVVSERTDHRVLRVVGLDIGPTLGALDIREFTRKADKVSASLADFKRLRARVGRQFPAGYHRACWHPRPLARGRVDPRVIVQPDRREARRHHRKRWLQALRS